MQPINYSAMQVKSDPYAHYQQGLARKTEREMALRQLSNQERAAASQEAARVAQTGNAAERLAMDKEKMEIANERAAQAAALAERNFDLNDKRFGLDQQKFEAEQSLAAKKQAAIDKKVSEAKAMQKDMIEFSQRDGNTAKDYQAMIAKYPEMAKELRQSYDLASDAGKDQLATEASQIYAAVQSGNTDIAKDLIKARGDAYRNSGDEKGYAGSQAMLAIMEADPNAAKVSVGLYLASVTDGTKLAYTLGALEKLDPGNTAADIRGLGDLGRELDLTQSEINRTLAGTRGKSRQEREAALYKTAGVDAPAPAEPAKAETSQAPVYKEGDTATNPTTGEVLILKNNQWVPKG